jgi:hypothetical protein
VLDAVIARNPAKAEKAILVLIDGAADDIDAGAGLAPQAAVAGAAGAAALAPARAGLKGRAAGAARGLVKAHGRIMQALRATSSW